jgi:hypothetical protein
MKYILLLLLILLFVIPVKPVSAIGETPSHVLFINQVRGSECCAKGIFKHLEMQADTFIETGIPAYFALRYDVITDPQYVLYLKNLSESYPETIELGILLEVTPTLAKASGVTYRGSHDKWYEAQDAYSIGYTDKENRKLIDTLFQSFFNEFGYYPQLTSAWMIEAETLNYLTETYGVKIHQITREQWGTDSYTLYGGVPHYPYPASNKWAFMPDYERENAPLIVRQTITDPLKNFGDVSSAFTSQPNDYSNDEKKFEYFELLLKQAVVEQPQVGFAMLGLETSMDSIYQDEYIKQIQHVKKLFNDGLVEFPDIETLSVFWKNQRMNIYWGKDLDTVTPNEAYWITTPAYRLRLRKSNNELFISDLRYFYKNYDDPYSKIQARKEGFWIMPYFVDGSLWYSLSKEKIQKNLFVKLLAKPEVVQKFPDPQIDMNSKVTSIVLPKFQENADPEITFENGIYSFKYKKENGEDSALIFNPDSITITNLKKNEISFKNFMPSDHPLKYSENKDGFSLSWMIDKKKAHTLKTSCTTSCTLSFSATNEYLSDMRKKQYPFIFPEPIAREINSKNSLFYVHNYFAIVGRNPIRIIVIPYDRYGIPTTLSKPVAIDSKKSIKIEQNIHDKQYFIDVYSTAPSLMPITIKLNDSVTKKTTIYFAPNCKINIKSCLLNPLHSFWYVNTILRDKFRLYFENEIQ